MKVIQNMQERGCCKFVVLSIAIIVGAVFTFPTNTINSYASSKVEISKKTIATNVGKTVSLKVTGTNKKVSWSSNNKKIATVSGGKIKAKRSGKVTITANVGSKKLRCKVRVYPNYKPFILGIWSAHDAGRFSGGNYIEWEFKKNGKYSFVYYCNPHNADRSITTGKYRINGNKISLTSGDIYTIKKTKKKDHFILENKYHKYMLYPRHV